jgi:hypothetical protein
MAVDHLKDLKRLREILRKRRRKLVATMVGAKKEPTKFTLLVELQEACDTVHGHLRTRPPRRRKAKDNEPRPVRGFVTEMIRGG